jgi:hypothetical protein
MRVEKYRPVFTIVHSKACMLLLLITSFLYACNENDDSEINGNNLFEYNSDMEARWSSPENINGEKGAGGKENNSAKGHPYDTIAAGKSYSLLDIQGTGIINRMWITINDRSPEMLRALKIEMFWDDEAKPAVSVPFGDFFGVGLGKTAAFQNALFSNAEGRSFVCIIPMPFKKAAKIIITNESNKTLRNIFFDVDYILLKKLDDDYLYFHAHWYRDTATALAKDFELLPRVTGRGRFLGVNIGINANPLYKNSWWGEGEVKMYLDGDTNYPTLNGTGTEDYIGTAWGQGKFTNNYSGCLIADDSSLQWCYYRYHIPDPVFFKTGCRVTIQQIGGNGTNAIEIYQQSNLPLIPVTTDDGKIHPYYNKDSVVHIDTTTMPQGWTNFYRTDDVSATAYFYLDKASDNLSALQPVSIRAINLGGKK